MKIGQIDAGDGLILEVWHDSDPDMSWLLDGAGITVDDIPPHSMGDLSVDSASMFGFLAHRSHEFSGYDARPLEDWRDDLSYYAGDFDHFALSGHMRASQCGNTLTVEGRISSGDGPETGIPFSEGEFTGILSVDRDPDGQPVSIARAEGIVWTLAQYDNGDCYGFRLVRSEPCHECGHHEETEIDSCWGFVGPLDDSEGSALLAILDHAGLDPALAEGFEWT